MKKLKLQLTNQSVQNNDGNMIMIKIMIIIIIIIMIINKNLELKNTV